MQALSKVAADLAGPLFRQELVAKFACAAGVDGCPTGLTVGFRYYDLIHPLLLDGKLWVLLIGRFGKVLSTHRLVKGVRNGSFKVCGTCDKVSYGTFPLLHASPPSTNTVQWIPALLCVTLCGPVLSSTCPVPMVTGATLLHVCAIPYDNCAQPHVAVSHRLTEVLQTGVSYTAHRLNKLWTQPHSYCRSGPSICSSVCV